MNQAGFPPAFSWRTAALRLAAAAQTLAGNACRHSHFSDEKSDLTKRRHRAGTTNKSTSVQVTSPPTITNAVVRKISKPGMSPMNSKGRSASPIIIAVIRIGANRSRTTWKSSSAPEDDACLPCSWRKRRMSMSWSHAAMPNTASSPKQLHRSFNFREGLTSETVFSVSLWRAPEYLAYSPRALFLAERLLRLRLFQ